MPQKSEQCNGKSRLACDNVQLPFSKTPVDLLFRIICSQGQWPSRSYRTEREGENRVSEVKLTCFKTFYSYIQIPLKAYLSQNMRSTVMRSHNEDVGERRLFDSAELILHVLHELLVPVIGSARVVLTVEYSKQEGAHVHVR